MHITCRELCKTFPHRVGLRGVPDAGPRAPGAAVLQLEDVIEDDAGKVIGGDGGLIDAVLNIVDDRGPLGGAATVPGIK